MAFWNYLDSAYHSVCILATVVLVSWSFHLYFLNDDVSRVDYKVFHDEEDQIYPSISLCFGNVFLEEKLKAYGVNQSLYVKFLKGEFFSQLMLNVSYKDVTINPHEYLLGIGIEQLLDNGDVNPNHDYWYDHTNQDQLTSWKPHWKPHAVDHFNHHRGVVYKCMMVDVPYIPNQHLSFIAVVMKKSIFPNGTRPVNPTSAGFFLVEMSYPNQRVRYSTGKCNWNVLSMNHSYGTKFIITGMEVLKRRNKKKEPCHEDWKEDDKMVRDTMIEKVNCTPPYWKEGDAPQKPMCTSVEEMKQLYQMSWKRYIPPCQQISKVSFVDTDYPSTYYTGRVNGALSNLNDYFYVALQFTKTTFKQIKLIKALDEQSLFGNIGGYVGACLGYSFLQIPCLIHALYAKCKNCFSNNAK